MKNIKLTDKQERLIQNWLATGNNRQAAIDAGYSPNVASVVACKLLKRPDVKALVREARRKDARKLKITKQRVLRELAKGLYRDPAGLEDERGIVVSSLRGIPKELRAIIDGFKVIQQLNEDGDVVSQKIEVKLMPKDRAVDMAMKHLGAYEADTHVVKAGIDWDSLYDRAPIVDPVDKAIEEET